MFKQIAVLSMTSVLLMAPVFAQRRGEGPPDPQTMVKMRVQFLTQSLSLTDAQQAKATSIYTDAATASSTIRTNLRTNRQSIQDAVKKNDTAAIESLSATAGTLNGQLLAIESKADAAFYAILTPDQQATYDSTPHGGPGGAGMERFPPPPPRDQ
jgi:Spy/CpxP family protein refolding chaperone